MISPVQFNRAQSRIFLIVYVFITLALRFWFEPYLENNYLASILIGLVLLIFLWFLIRIKFLNFIEQNKEQKEQK